MSSLEEIRNSRLNKLQKLKGAGINPYPAKVPRDFDIVLLKKSFTEFEKNKKEISIAGRIMAIRGQGAILFAVLFDGTEKFQTIFKKDELDEKWFSLFVDTADMGDFISVTGPAITSERGEPSILVKSWTMATKSLLPLP
ncbi:MAG: OB-fold nucleic acid binding domain-containing protein, partial [Patescibacteria group bacterium]